jgi:hypothetical protein
MTNGSITLLILNVFFLLLSTSVESLGGNNLFGIFRKRRWTLQKIQEKREVAATQQGFAGPNGGVLNSTEAASLQRVDKNPVAYWWFSRR